MALTEAQMSGVPGSVGICSAANWAAMRLEISAGAFAVAEPTGAPVLTLDLEWGMCARCGWDEEDLELTLKIWIRRDE